MMMISIKIQQRYMCLFSCILCWNNFQLNQIPTELSRNKVKPLPITYALTWDFTICRSQHVNSRTVIAEVPVYDTVSSVLYYCGTCATEHFEMCLNSFFLIFPWNISKLIYLWERTPVPIKKEVEWTPRASLGIFENRKISCPCLDSNPGSSSP